MKRVRIAPGLLATACAIAVAAAPATAAEFKASKTGATKGVGSGEGEVFKLNPMTINCYKNTSTGSVESLSSETLKKVSVKYTQCKTFGSISVTPSAANFEFNANGTVRIEEPITFNVSTLKCSITIAPQTIATPLALYSDITEYNAKRGFPEGQQKLGIRTVLSELSYKASNWPCAGPTKEEQPEEREGSEGKYTGEMKDELVGGNLTFVP